MIETKSREIKVFSTHRTQLSQNCGELQAFPVCTLWFYLAIYPSFSADQSRGTRVRTADEDGQRGSGQWNDKW